MFNFIFPTFLFRVEKWKWNKEYRVYVSNLGHVKDEHKNILPVKVSNSGYCVVKTYYGFKNIHRLVLLTWKPVPNAEELTVDHLNHNKRDNSIQNLEWVTEKENLRRARKDRVPLAEDTVSKEEIKKLNNSSIEAIDARGEKLLFKNYNEAINFLICTKTIGENCDIQKVKIKIMKAAYGGKPYCNRVWRIIN